MDMSSFTRMSQFNGPQSELSSRLHNRCLYLVDEFVQGYINYRILFLDVCSKYTEVLQNGAWEKLPDYAYGTIFFGAGISGWAHTSSETAVYIIGGYEHFGMGQQMHPLAYIAKFENDSWEKLNTKLNHRRYGHSAIWLENELMIIGGFAEPGRTQ